MTREEVLKMLNELQGKGFLQNVHIADKTISQEVVNDFSIEQLDVLFQKNLILKEQYESAQRFQRDCKVKLQTCIKIMMDTLREVEIPYEALRGLTDKDLQNFVKANFITIHAFEYETNRRQKALLKFKELCNSSSSEKNKQSINFADFVVLSNVFRCNKNHHIEQIQAQVAILTPSGEIENRQVGAGYCNECNIYFILETDFQYLSTFGILLCRKLTRDVYLRNGDDIINGEELNAESLLHQIGYNVNAKANLGTIQRQNLLKLAIDNSLYSISGLLSFLDWLIARNKKVSNRNMNSAIEKWSADRDFIAKYQADKQRKVEVKSISAKNEDWDF